MTASPTKAMSALTLALCLAALVVFVPVWAPLVLAAWFADLLHPVARRLERLLRGRRRAAGALVVLVLFVVLLPLVGVGVALTHAVQAILGQLRTAIESGGSLGVTLLRGDGGGALSDVRGWTDLLGRVGANAWLAVSTFVRASATAVIGALVFTTALYTFTVDGERAYAWLEARMPLPRAHLARLAGAFRETGRGLLVAGVGTALLQGALATIAYVAIGVPRALVFGPLTAVAALVPAVGTGLVWVPLAAELAVTGHYGRAIVLAVVGAGVLSLVDNFVRPILARYGRLNLPTFVVWISILGGIGVFGPTGALLGPLLVRLSVEALAVLAEAQRRPDPDVASEAT